MRLKPLRIGIALAAAAAGALVAPGVAHALPAPYNCSVTATGPESASAVCASGYGWQRATIECRLDTNPNVTQWFYGPWTAVRTASNVSCGAGYGSPKTRGYQTQAV